LRPEDDGHPDRFRQRLYGRRQGHALRAGQLHNIEDRLPRLRAPIDGPVRFSDPSLTATWLEIGFGGGEHLAGQIKANPGIGFIGAEPFVNGMASLLGKSDPEQDGRLMLWDQDARLLLPRIPAHSLARAFLLFPDPWPKKRHHKRRFVAQDTLAMLHAALKPGAEFRVATDIADYADWTMIEVTRHGGFDWPVGCADDWRLPPDDHIRTRYETKALKAGRKPVYLRFIRR
jgi:tRNA (guanine-N7-)-methyltransferase